MIMHAGVHRSALALKHISEVSDLKLFVSNMAIFTFFRTPTKHEDWFGVRKDIRKGVTRSGNIVLFVRASVDSDYMDDCKRLERAMRENDREHERKRVRFRT